MQHENTQIDWLSELDGKSIAEAIVYLYTLDQSMILNYYLNINLYGCDIDSNLIASGM